MMQPTNNHLPTLNGIKTHPLSSVGGQLLKIWLDHDEVVNMVMAVKISETWTRNDLRTMM